MAQGDPTITNVPSSGVATVDTEYEIEIPGGATRFEIRLRSGSAWRRAWVTGKVAGSVAPYATVPKGSVYKGSSQRTTTARTLYVATSESNEVFEVETWDALQEGVI